MLKQKRVFQRQYQFHWDNNEHILFDILMRIPSSAQVETYSSNHTHLHVFQQLLPLSDCQQQKESKHALVVHMSQLESAPAHLHLLDPST